MNVQKRFFMLVVSAALLATALMLLSNGNSYADEDALQPRNYLPIAVKANLPPTPTPTPGAFPTPDTGAPLVTPPPSLNCTLPDVGFTSNQFIYSTWGQSVELNTELCNPTTRAYSNLKYQLDALNATGGVIESVISTDYRVVWPGEFLCINNYLSIKPPGVASYRFTLLSKTESTRVRRRISVLNHSYSRTSQQLTGQLRNDDPSAVISPWMSAALYDNQNRILLCDEYVTLNTYTLSPNQVTSFSASFYVFNADAQSIFNRVATYRVSISQ